MINLKQILNQPDTIIFIGSGISLWSGLPTWSGMIEELAVFVEQRTGGADLIRAEANKGDLLQAASYGFDKLTKQQIGEFVRAACRYGRAKPHEIHRKIVSLGPRCYITTNYDDLIEQSLREWQPDRFYRSAVTNRQLTETAEIVHARAVDFIFKPHGDAGDSESIILTREQYRRLLPHGESQAALESVKMLLASRPVLYIGFGLRDPDFIYIRDLLANTYKGGVRDHYAIMADVHEQEVDYWRRNYGIHLIGYDSVIRPDNSRDHAPLLSLLDSFLERSNESEKLKFDPESSDVLLSLARHAAALSRHPKQHPELPIRVNQEGGRKKNTGFESHRYYHGLVDKLLDFGPPRAILIGLPGAGKTYSLHRAAARLADQLNEICLSGNFVRDLVVVPIIVDLKLYRGDLDALVNQSLPEKLPLHDLITSYKVKIFIDSFNEMPREFLENGSYEADFLEFIGSLGDASLVIGSRTTDGLSRLEFQTFRLDFIEEEAVTAELTRLGINFEGRFSKEMFRLIQRPFYFKYIVSGKINLPPQAQPKDFYKCLFDNVTSAFYKRFNLNLDIQEALSNTAYNALDKGAEAFQIANLIGDLNEFLIEQDGPTPIEIVNWLVSESILIPYTKGRIGFVHQSITEYLAANELAKRYSADPRELKEKLSLRRWDQGLFLTLSFLPDARAKSFFDDVVKADLALAISASKYSEFGRDEIVSELLEILYHLREEGGELPPKVESAIRFGLQVSGVHEGIIRKFIDFGASLGGIALGLLASIRGASIMQEAVNLLFVKRNDFNFCLTAAESIYCFATEETFLDVASFADKIQAEINSIQSKDWNVYEGFSMAVGILLQELELPVITKLLPEGHDEHQYRSKLLCEILGEHSTPEALSVAGDLLLKGVNYAAEAIANITASLAQDNPSALLSLNYAHATRLIELIDRSWAADALREICLVQPDLARQVQADSKEFLGLKSALISNCVNPLDMGPVFRELDKIVCLSAAERQHVPFNFLDSIEIDWKGREAFFLKLLELRDVNLASAIMGGTYPVTLKNLGELDLGDVTWWLKWMHDEMNDDEGGWFLFRLGDLFGTYACTRNRKAFIKEFNERSEFRSLLQSYVLGRLDITTDEIDDDAISFMLAELSKKKAEHNFGTGLLGSAATESFITDRVLPLLIKAQEPLRGNLYMILERAGSRHGRRYLVQ
jgi:hypothetical protein